MKYIYTPNAAVVPLFHPLHTINTTTEIILEQDQDSPDCPTSLPEQACATPHPPGSEGPVIVRCGPRSMARERLRARSTFPALVRGSPRSETPF